MQPLRHKKLTRAYRLEGSAVQYRSAARRRFKTKRSLFRAVPSWSVALAAPLLLRTLLRLVFLCPHRRKGPPITLREPISFSLSGHRTGSSRGTYITCLDCGQRFAYNCKTGRLLDFWGIHDEEALARVRRTVDGFLSRFRGLAARVGRLNMGMAMSELVRPAHGLGISIRGQWTKARRWHSALPRANRLTRQAALTQKVTRSGNGDDRPFPDFIDYGELHTAFLQVHRRSQRHHLER